MATNFQSVAEILKSLPKSKRIHVDVDDMKTDPKIQIRFMPGENVFGFQTEFGDTGLNDLKVSIAEQGRILVPLVLWKRATVTKDGKNGHEYIVLRGNRRSQAGKELKKDPNCGKQLFDALSKVECEVYDGITEEQAIALVDDQSSVNKYKRVDVVNVIWKMMSRIPDYKEIGLAHARLIGEVYLDNSQEAKKNLAKLMECKTKSEQLALIGTWLRGSLDQGIMDANTLGERTRKAFLLTVAWEDGLIKEGMEKPEFNPKARQIDGEKGNKKTRIAILKGIKKEMESAAQPWDVTGEGPDDPKRSRFHKQIDQWIQEEKGEVERVSIQRPTIMGLNKLKDVAKSTAIKSAYALAAGEKIDNADVIDAEAYRCESIFGELNNMLNKGIKNPEVATVVAFIVKSNNVEELRKQFEKYM